MQGLQMYAENVLTSDQPLAGGQQYSDPSKSDTIRFQGMWRLARSAFWDIVDDEENWAPRTKTIQSSFQFWSDISAGLAKMRQIGRRLWAQCLQDSMKLNFEVAKR